MRVDKGTELSGGLMNAPKLIRGRVHRKRTESTETIHRLLKHVRARGIDWVPEPISFDEQEEVISYIEGEVPHDMPPWIWSREVLADAARAMRSWHDAARDFDIGGASWSFSTGTEPETICHNDFAPYNCVFSGKRFAGLIDFDLCAPGSRLWDMSYTAYRFVPVMPESPLDEGEEFSPFSREETIKRVELFLEAYAGGSRELSYSGTA
ncbi:MAG: aminoglycoside phosphotransferase family protein, partial [Spirochaetales bacterium]|nr:aminoglycoside phosphotransferase family protein [Spirochaetales bacterium]